MPAHAGGGKPAMGSCHLSPRNLRSQSTSGWFGRQTRRRRVNGGATEQNPEDRRQNSGEGPGTGKVLRPVTLILSPLKGRGERVSQPR